MMNQEADKTIENEEITTPTPEELAAQAAAEAAAAEAAGGTGEGTGEPDEIVVTIGGEAPTPEEDENNAQAPAWVKELRRTNRELVKKNRELQEQVQKAAATTETKPVDPGKKPALQDFDYDEEKYQTAMEQWYEKKRKADEANDRAAAEARSVQEAWLKQLDTYGQQRSGLKVKDFEDAESLVADTLSQFQQATIIKGAKNAALLIYALGKNPTKLRELSSIKDPVEYTFAVARLEGELKVANRKKEPPTPERTVRGNASLAGAVDSQLEALRAEAMKSGDFTKVNAYKREKRRAQS